MRVVTTAHKAGLDLHGQRWLDSRKRWPRGTEFVWFTEGYELPEEAVANLFELTPAQRAKAGIVPLPVNLSEALDEMERSELVHDALGDHIFEWFLRNKRAEFSEYRAQVTPYELSRYLPSW